MGQDGNTIEIEIDAAATQAAAKTAGEANAKLEEFNNALKLFRDNVGAISKTTDSVAGKIGDFNTLLQTFSDKLTENLANMQTSVVAKVEPHLERELENLVNRVTNKVEAKYKPDTESRSRSEAKSGPAAPAIKVAQPPEYKQPDVKVKSTFTKLNNQTVDSRTGEVKETPTERARTTATRTRHWQEEIDGQLHDFTETITDVSSSVKKATTAEKDRGLAIRREITGALIGLHVMKVVSQYSAVFNAGFMQIAAAIGHLLNNLLLPMMPMFTQVAQFLHMLANVIAMLPMPVRQLIGALVVWKGVSMMVAGLPIKDFADGIRMVRDNLRGSGDLLAKFGRGIVALIKFMNTNLMNDKIDALAGWIGRKIRRRASGGPVGGGEEYLVGEEGPEIFVPSYASDEFRKHLDKIASRYPTAAKALDPQIWGMSEKDKPGRYEEFGITTNKPAIAVRKDIMRGDAGDLFKDDVEAGFHPEGSESGYSALWHEFGHHLKKSIEKGLYGDDVKSEFERFKQSVKPGKDVSIYGWGDDDEGFAEAFVAKHFSSPEYNAKSPYISKLSETLEKIKYRAAGGPVLGHGAYIVGEKGPEIFVPKVSGAIIPNHKMGRAEGGDVTSVPGDTGGLLGGPLPGLPGGTDVLGNIGAGLGAGGLAYMLTGSLGLAAVAGGAAGMLGPEGIADVVTGAVSSEIGQTVIGSINTLSGILTSLLAPLAPIMGVVGAVAGLATGGRSALGGGDGGRTADTVARVGTEQLKATGKMSYGIQNVTSATGRGQSKILTNILLKLGAGIPLIGLPKLGFGELLDAIKDFIKGIKEFLEKLKSKLDEFIKELKRLWEELKSKFREAWEEMKRKLREAWEELKTKLREAWEELKRKLGEAWEELKNKLRESWEELKSRLREGWDELKNKLREAWEDLKTKLRESWEELKKKLRESWDDLKTKLREAWEDLKSKLRESWDELKTKFREAFEDLKTKLRESWDELKTKLRESWDEFKGKIRESWEELKTKLRQSWEEAKTKFREAFEDLKAKLRESWDELKSRLRESWDEFKGKIRESWEELKTKLRQSWEEAKAKLREAWDELKAKLSEKWEELKGKLRESWDELKSKLRESWEELKGKLRESWDELKEKLRGSWDDIKSRLGEAWEDLKTRLRSAWDELKTKIAESWSELKTRLGEAWEDMKTRLRGSWEELKSRLSGAWDELKTKLSGSWEELRTKLSTLGDVLKAKITGVIEYVKLGAEALKGIDPLRIREAIVGKITAVPESITGFVEWLRQKLVGEKVEVRPEVKPPTTDFIDLAWKTVGKAIGEFVGLAILIALKDFFTTGKFDIVAIVKDLAIATAVFVLVEKVLTALATAIGGATAGALVTKAFALLGAAITPIIAAGFEAIAVFALADLFQTVDEGIRNHKIEALTFNLPGMQVAYEWGKQFGEDFEKGIFGVIATIGERIGNFMSGHGFRTTEEIQNLLKAGKTMPEIDANPDLKLSDLGIELDASGNFVRNLDKFNSDFKQTVAGGIPVDVKIDVDSVTSVVEAVRETAMGTPISGGASVPGETVQECPTGSYWDRALQACAPIRGSVIPSHASGGFVTPGIPNLVGEKGPELFVPSGPGEIIPNSKLGSLGGGGNITNNVTIHVTTNNPKELTDTVMKQLKLELARVKM